MKNIIIAILTIIILIGGGAYLYKSDMLGFSMSADNPVVEQQTQDVATTTEEVAVSLEENETVIGKSVEGRNISAFKYGSGDKKIIFVGGIHGGYSWNTALVAYELMDYLKANPTKIPANVEVTVVPVLNPDGLNKVVGSAGRFDMSAVPTEQAALVGGRFNANNVDLNRNFDCDWQPSGMWQNTAVDGGTAVFSEPEAVAMRDFVAAYKPTAVVGWYSSAGGVYSSDCHGGVLPVTKAMTSAYAKASGYTAHESFDNYAITGDMENWLAKNKIPAISVLLTTHKDVEWDKNQKGVEALLTYFGK